MCIRDSTQANVGGKSVAEALVRTKRLSADAPEADQRKVLDALKAQSVSYTHLDVYKRQIQE